MAVGSLMLLSPPTAAFRKALPNARRELIATLQAFAPIQANISYIDLAHEACKIYKLSFDGSRPAAQALVKHAAVRLKAGTLGMREGR